MFDGATEVDRADDIASVGVKRDADAGGMLEEFKIVLGSYEDYGLVSRESGSRAIRTHLLLGPIETFHKSLRRTPNFIADAVDDDSASVGETDDVAER